MRVSLILGAAFIAVLSLVSTLSIHSAQEALARSENQIKKALIAKGKILTQNNSEALKGMVEDNAFSAIQILVSSTVQADSDILFGVFMDIENSNIIVLENDEKNYKKSNELIRKYDSFTSKESHLEEILHQAITNSHREEQSLVFVFIVAELLSKLNLRTDDHTALSDLTKGMSKPVEIHDTNAKRLFQGSMFTFIYENYGGAGSVVRVKINEEAAKFFYHLKKSKSEQRLLEDNNLILEEDIESIFAYTKINKAIAKKLGHLNKLKALKFYQILKSHEFKNKLPSLVIVAVKKSLGVEGKYKKPYDFYNKFLLPITLILNEHTDLWVHVELRKQGKSYKYIDPKIVGGNLFRQYLSFGFAVNDESLNKWFYETDPKILGLVLKYVKLLLDNNEISNGKEKISKLMKLKKLTESYLTAEIEQEEKQKQEEKKESVDKDFEEFKKSDVFKKYIDLGFSRNDPLIIEKFTMQGHDFLKQAFTSICL